MTDAEIAKKYAEDKISLAVSMYNPGAESIAETACLYGLTYKNKQLAGAKEIILKLYNAGRDVLMCRAEEKAYDNLDEAISDKSIEQFLKEVEE